MSTTADWQEKVAELYHRFREDDLSGSPLWVRILVNPARITACAYEEFFADKCLQRASALAFASLLALVPVTVIFFSFLTKLEAFSEIRGKVQDFLFQNMIPARTEIIREYLAQYSEKVTLLGVFGITTLFITAIVLFNTIEHTINEIWHAKQKRPFLSKFSAFWTVLTATPMLVFVSSWVAAKYVDVFHLKFLPYLLNWFAFWFAYQFIPYTPVRVRAAFVGAIIGGTLWELAKGTFNWYIANMTAFDTVYGSLGAIPVFLVWIYLTWVIVLFGAEVAYAVQYPMEKSRTDHEKLAGYLDFYSVRTMAEIVRRFAGAENGAASGMDNLKNIGIPSDILGEILNRLSEKQLIVYTENKQYLPAREPSQITIREIVEAVSGRKMLAPESPDDAVSRRLTRAFVEVAAGVDSALEELDFQTLLDGSEE